MLISELAKLSPQKTMGESVEGDAASHAVQVSGGRRMLPGKALPPSEVPDYSINRDDLSEIYAEVFARRLKALNAFVDQSGEPLEGSIFYWRRDQAYADSAPAADLAPARRNFWRAARFKKS